MVNNFLAYGKGNRSLSDPTAWKKSPQRWSSLLLLEWLFPWAVCHPDNIISESSVWLLCCEDWLAWYRWFLTYSSSVQILGHTQDITLPVYQSCFWHVSFFFFAFSNNGQICLSFLWHLFLLGLKTHGQKWYSLHSTTLLSFFFSVWALIQFRLISSEVYRAGKFHSLLWRWSV